MSDAGVNTAPAAGGAANLTELKPRAVRQGARARTLRLWNRAVQVVMLLVIGQWSFYGIFRCPFVVPYISCQNCPVVACHGRLFTMFWGVWAGWLALAALFGRAFCGWACPGGTVNRLLGLFAPLRLKPGGLAARLLPFGKYGGLALALWAYFVLGQPRVNVPIRTGEFLGAVALTFEHAMPLWLVRTWTVVGILSLGVAVSAAWCRFACPAGGVLEVVRRFAPFAVYKTDACNGCDKCRKVCYMATRPGETNCTNCGDCIGSCPQDCIGMGRQPR